MRIADCGFGPFGAGSGEVHVAGQAGFAGVAQQTEQVGALNLTRLATIVDDQAWMRARCCQREKISPVADDGEPAL